MHTADAVLARYRRELGFGIEWQIDDLVLDVTALQKFTVVVHGGQQFAGVYGAIQLLATERLTHQDPSVASSRQLQHRVDAARRTAILAKQLEVTVIGLRYEHLSAHIGGLASLLDLDGLRQYLIFLAGAQEQCGALQRGRRKGGHAQRLMLPFEYFGHRRQRLFGKVAQINGRGITKTGCRQYDLAIGGGHVAIKE